MPGSDVFGPDDDENRTHQPKTPNPMYRGNRNYIFHTTAITLSVIAVLMAVRTVPSFGLLGAELRRADIVADVVARDTSDDTEPGPSLAYTEPSSKTSGKVPDTTVDTLPAKSKPSVTAEERDTIAATKTSATDDTADTTAVTRTRDGIVPIEDYSPDGSALDAFRAAVARRDDRVVRIGVMGDSFIEGDIMTADLREILQDRLGGSGVGFVPITSIVSKLRQTVAHTYSGWKTHSVRKRNGADIDSRFTISGYVYTPENDNATVTYRTTDFKRHLKNIRSVDFFFVNRENTEIRATVNDTTVLVFTPPAGEEMQKITVASEVPVSKVRFDFKNVGGFYAYGASIGGSRGVQVDNFGDRGTSGLQMSKLLEGPNTRFDELHPYDLIIIEYGLNVVTRGTMRYTSFEEQMSAIVANVKACYPGASVIVMGLSDRSSNQEGVYRTMPEVKAMIRHQKAIARNAGVAYWDTFTAMGGDDSMVRFVAKRWASKDYTHVSPRGAAFIAERLAEALVDAL